MNIRIATLEDKELFFDFLKKTVEVTIWKDFYPNLDMEALASSFLSPSNRNDRMIIFILDENDIEVGMASLDAYSFPDSPVKIARLRSVFLNEDQRGKGFMNTILDALHYWAKQVGCSYCNIGAKEGIDLEKHGYKLMEILYLKDIR